MANPFDQFDAPKESNPFDQFDSPSAQAVEGSAPEDLSYALEMEEAPTQEMQQEQPQGGRGLLENIGGAAETALAIGTGATGGMAGQFAGTAEGLVKEIVSGNFGSQEAADRIEQLAMKRAQQLTYAPRGEAGKEQLGAVGEVLQPLEAIPPIAQVQALGSAARFAAPQATAAARQAAPQIAQAGKQVATTAARAADDVAQKVKSRVGRGDYGQSKRSVGAAETPMETQRALRSQATPVPFEGDSALTKGQLSRDFEQLQFEKETAKAGDLGAPLRERAENQTNTLIANLDAVSDLSEPQNFELRDIGRGIDNALKNKHKSMKARERKLYDDAEKSGAMEAKVSLSDARNLLSSLDEMEGLADNASAIKRQAMKRGFIVEGDNGVIAAPKKSLKEVEQFRQFVNRATDITDPREARVRAIALSSIDDSTEGVGGEAYKRARKYSSDMRKEFDNVGITKKLTSNKRGTSERQIAYEDAFKKIMLDSPIEEINKLRGTLLKSGADGKQAWADLKAKGIDYIKENALSKSQSLEGGAPVISPDKLNRVIQRMDEGGKLESIYGKRNAQVLRDLGDISKDILTAPPGSVNFSNTASALRVVLDSVATGAATGVPLPVLTAFRQGMSTIKDAKTKRKIKSTLNYLENSQN